MAELEIYLIHIFRFQKKPRDYMNKKNFQLNYLYLSVKNYIFASDN